MKLCGLTKGIDPCRHGPLPFENASLNLLHVEA